MLYRLVLIRRKSTSYILLIVTALLAGAALTQPASAYNRPGLTKMVSVASDGSQAVYPTEVFDRGVYAMDIAAGGGFVAFDSSAPNLAPGDVNLSPDVFVHDLRSGKTEPVSLSSRGVQGLGACGLNANEPTKGQGALDPAISATGRYVAFRSCFVNLVEGDTNREQDIFVHDRKNGQTVRVSVSTKGQQANDASTEPAISDNGRFVAFRSDATNLVADDSNGLPDVFVHDLKTGRTRLVSQTSGGEQAQGDPVSVFIQGSNCPSLSANGRYVSFQSTAPLVGDDSNLSTDVYLRDLSKGETTRVSVGTDGREARGNEHYTKFMSGNCYNGLSGRTVVSANGRYVSFYSTATTLVPNDANANMSDVFVHDRKTNRTERVSVDPAGSPGRSWSSLSSISSDGRFVAFESWSGFFRRDTGNYGPALGLVQPGDGDIFVHDRRTGALEWISMAPGGGESMHCNDSVNPLSPPDESASYSRQPSLGSNGRLVAYISCADNLVASDQNNAWDAFVRDRGRSLGATPAGEEAADVVIPGDESFRATGLARSLDSLGDTDVPAADIIELRLARRPQYRDLFGVIELRNMDDLGGLQTMADLPFTYALTMRVNGERYEVRARSVPGIQGGRFSLHRCEADDRCTGLAELEGGFGTTGHRITVSIPVEDLRTSTEKLNITQITASSLVGGHSDVPASILDTATIR